ncbi:hypothetical protein Baya_16581 [Bagarius yarrelli]|uniref:Uncharacterized protein n=1 Tax=Bagarius yarrelli TaxID=175774 RepID=A0A556VVU5_BAGYA|nr:hypothetical protein Baya_16581 [Bagarius yarrelli]
MLERRRFLANRNHRTTAQDLHKRPAWLQRVPGADTHSRFGSRTNKNPSLCATFDPAANDQGGHDDVFTPVACLHSGVRNSEALTIKNTPLKKPNNDKGEKSYCLEDSRVFYVPIKTERFYAVHSSKTTSETETQADQMWPASSPSKANRESNHQQHYVHVPSLLLFASNI